MARLVVSRGLCKFLLYARPCEHVTSTYCAPGPVLTWGSHKHLMSTHCAPGPVLASVYGPFMCTYFVYTRPWPSFRL